MDKGLLADGIMETLGDRWLNLWAKAEKLYLKMRGYLILTILYLLFSFAFSPVPWLAASPSSQRP